MTDEERAARETFKAYVLEALKTRGINPAHCPLALHGILAVATKRGARGFPRVFRLWARWLAEAEPIDLVHAMRTLSAMAVCATERPEDFKALEAGPMRRLWWTGAGNYTRRLSLKQWRA